MSAAPAVEISVPATAADVRVLRTVVAGGAATSSLGMDRLDDLGLAVQEACSLILTTTVPGARLTSHVVTGATTVSVRVQSDGAAARWPPPGWSESLSATVLETLADRLVVHVVEGCATVDCDFRVT